MVLPELADTHRCGQETTEVSRAWRSLDQFCNQNESSWQLGNATASANDGGNAGWPLHGQPARAGHKVALDIWGWIWHQFLPLLCFLAQSVKPTCLIGMLHSLTGLANIYWAPALWPFWCWAQVMHRKQNAQGLCSHGLPRWLSGKKSSCQCRRHGRHGFDPWVGKIPGGGNSNPLWYSCLEIPWTEECGGLQSLGSQRVRRDWA